jgi:hypothetical protein
MPTLALELTLGEGDANVRIGPLIQGVPDGVIQAESGAFLQVEAGQYLAFD